MWHPSDRIRCLTYEQPVSIQGGASATNRKFRILMAREGLVKLALKSKPWDTFRSKGKPAADGTPTPYTKYCDRRWLHLRTMGEIMEMKKVLQNDPDVSAAAKNHDLEWLNTFFVDTIDVVSPRFHTKGRRGAGAVENKRAWEDAAWMEEWAFQTQPRAADPRMLHHIYDAAPPGSGPVRSCEALRDALTGGSAHRLASGVPSPEAGLCQMLLDAGVPALLMSENTSNVWSPDHFVRLAESALRTHAASAASRMAHTHDRNASKPKVPTDVKQSP